MVEELLCCCEDGAVEELLCCCGPVCLALVLAMCGSGVGCRLIAFCSGEGGQCSSCLALIAALLSGGGS